MQFTSYQTFVHVFIENRVTFRHLNFIFFRHKLSVRFFAHFLRKRQIDARCLCRIMALFQSYGESPGGGNIYPASVWIKGNVSPCLGHMELLAWEPRTYFSKLFIPSNPMKTP